MTVKVTIAKGQTSAPCPHCGTTYTNISANTTEQDCVCTNKKCRRIFRVVRAK